ncbi:hypothetical protein ACFLZK_00305 [Patescibacteria group bacterium]
MKKVLFAILFSIILSFSSKVYAQEAPDVNLYLFWSEGCPHCHEEREFLDDLVKEKPNLIVNEYEITKSFKNTILFSDVGKYLEADTKGVPFTVIGTKEFAGFGSAETTGKTFIEAIEKVEAGEDYDVLEEFFAERNAKEETKKEKKEKKVIDWENSTIPEVIDLGILGTINPRNLSLPVLTFLIAIVDGFNPCAMWVLLFLISMLIGFEDRKRMWILGLSFIAASAFVYFLFMAAWLNFFLFFGFVIWIRLLVGAVALYFGFRSIRSFIKNDDDGCEVTQDEKRVKTLEKIKDITKKDNLFLAIGGIVLLAFAINLVEAVCSAGLPAIYTQILTLNKLPTAKYYMYILLYQVVFMLDDMIIFAIAMITMKSIGIESKYARVSKIIGGVVMVIIGLLLIFKPELLLFG